MAEALSLTATRAAGLKSQFGTMGKPLNAGFAAEVGTTCALLAFHGASSFEGALDEAQGFGPTHAGEARATAWDGLGTDWSFPDVSYKFHACCHGLHAMLEAIAGLRADGLDPAAVESVVIRTHPRWLAVCNKPAPETGLGAKFSFRLTAAMGLSGVDTGALETFSDGVAQRPDLVELRDKVRVEGDPDLTDMQASVAVRTDGGTREAAHDLAAPIAPETLADSLHRKAVTLLGEEKASAVQAAIPALVGEDGPASLYATLFESP